MKSEWLGIAEDITADGVVGDSYRESSPKSRVSASQAEAPDSSGYGALFIFGILFWWCMYAYGHDAWNWLRANAPWNISTAQASSSSARAIKNVPPIIVTPKHDGAPARVQPVAKQDPAPFSRKKRPESGRPPTPKIPATKTVKTASTLQPGGRPADSELDLEEFRRLARGL